MLGRTLFPGTSIATLFAAKLTIFITNIIVMGQIRNSAIIALIIACVLKIASNALFYSPCPMDATIAIFEKVGAGFRNVSVRRLCSVHV
eukprot:m.68308 g.68308  ORF g.68308 m.68308 type:complete len:89 (+) comp23943_c4_seq1:670-936(+)